MRSAKRTRQAENFPPARVKHLAGSAHLVGEHRAFGRAAAVIAADDRDPREIDLLCVRIALVPMTARAFVRASPDWPGH